MARKTPSPTDAAKGAPLPAVHRGEDIKKPVEAIAVNPRAGKLTLLTRKLFNVLLQMAQNQGMQKETYRIPLGEICSTARFDSNDTGLIKEHLRKMNACQVEWNTGVKGSRRWGVTNLISEVEVIEDSASGRCHVEWTYSPKIKAQLLEPETYTRLSLQFQSSLRSSAALALYEICCRYATSPTGLTMRQPWDWWRPVLTGVPDGNTERAYLEYKYFKRDVVKPSVSEVNSVTDLVVELIEHKDGRRVSELQFQVAKKPQTQLPLSDTNVLNMELVARLMKLGLSQQDVEQIYSHQEESRIQAALEVVEQRVGAKGLPAVGSPAAYFKDALRNRYAAVKDKEAAVARKNAPDIAPRSSRADVHQKLRAKRAADARGYFAEMGPEDRARALADFETEVLPTLSAPSRKAYQGKGLESPLVAGDFFDWMARTLWGEPTEGDLLDFMLEVGRI